MPFNGDFETTLDPWYLAGPVVGSTLTRDTAEKHSGAASMKLVDGGSGAGWSEAGNDWYEAMPQGRKSVTFWAKSAAPEKVWVYPYWGSAPEDWAEYALFKFNVTPTWQQFTGEWDQTLPAFTGLYFDQTFDDGGSGNTLWVDDIVIAPVPTSPELTPVQMVQSPLTSRLDTIVYQVPTGKMALVQKIVLANTSLSWRLVNLSLVPTRTVGDRSNRIMQDVDIPPEGVVAFDMYQVVAGAIAASSSADGLVLTVSGSLFDFSTIPGTWDGAGDLTWAGAYGPWDSWTQPVSWDESPAGKTWDSVPAGTTWDGVTNA